MMKKCLGCSIKGITTEAVNDNFFGVNLCDKCFRSAISAQDQVGVCFFCGKGKADDADVRDVFTPLSTCVECHTKLQMDLLETTADELVCAVCLEKGIHILLPESGRFVCKGCYDVSLKEIVHVCLACNQVCSIKKSPEMAEEYMDNWIRHNSDVIFFGNLRLVYNSLKERFMNGPTVVFSERCRSCPTE